ncbi:MAG: GTP 3',8-cyclase MoaA [Bacteroidota bacterium]
MVIDPIIDNHGRPIEYVRLAVTDRCNLRCFYCMPAEGIQYLPRKELLTYEEMLRMLEIMSKMGIRKVRITGGEPFLRKDLIYFLEDVSQIEGIDSIHITTNGVLTTRFIPQLVKIGVKSINLSLDTLNAERFKMITRRDEFSRVMNCLEALTASPIKTKINAVIMEGKNTDDILDLAAYSVENPVSVRFIEEMPFNGNGANYPILAWNHRMILERIKSRYPDLKRAINDKHDTATHYRIPGAKGTLGIIAAYSRTFCGSCNRIRVTPQGSLKTCLYDDGVLDLREYLRNGSTDAEVARVLRSAFNSRSKNGFEAERNRLKGKPVTESMSTIGG